MSAVQHTPRLLLRPPVASDLERLFAIYGDPATNVYNPFGPFADLEKARSVLTGWIEHWRQHGFGQWAIEAREAPGRVIGFGGIGYRKYLEQEALNLGYRFATEAWGHGYATELARAALQHAFGSLKLPEVFAIVRPVNQPSIHVLEKAGLQRIGSLDDVPGQEPSHLYRATALGLAA